MTETRGAGDRQLKSILDRVLRLKEEQDVLGEDIREVYAEAKSNGYDKTALGQAVTAIRKREKDPQRYAELTENAARYLAAYEGSLAPARARVENIEEFSPIAEAIEADADHIPDASNMVSDTENESPRISASHVAKALRDDAQPEGGMSGGSRPDQSGGASTRPGAAARLPTSARHVADESRASLLDANGFFTEPLPSYARQRQ